MSDADLQDQASQVLLRENQGPVAILTLNQPQAYNALSLALMNRLIDELADLTDDRSVHVVVIRGAGKGFCAGHNLRELMARNDRFSQDETFQTCSRLMQAVTALPKPVIAQVHGVATAAGCQLVASCDLALCDDQTRFATPGVNIGLFCSTPMVALSRVVAPRHALEMLLTGEPIDAGRALEIGLVNRVVTPDQLEAKTLELAHQLASKSPLTLKIGKQAFYRQLEMERSDAYRYCSQVMSDNLATEDAQEGISAFLEKRAPEWKGR